MFFSTTCFLQGVHVSNWQVQRPTFAFCSRRISSWTQARPGRNRTCIFHVSMQAAPVGADERDILLGELAFTDPDMLPKLVMARLDMFNDDFYQFIEEKIGSSSDLEERQTLRVLMEAIKQLEREAREQKKLGLDRRTGSAPEAADSAGQKSSVSSPADVAVVADAAYHALIDRFVAASEEPDAEVALKAIVEVEYEAIDKRFLDILSERMEKERLDSKQKSLERVKQAIADAMKAKMMNAAAKLKQILTAGSVEDMRRELETVAAKGGLDDALLLLLQGNMEQAKIERVQDVVKVLSILMDHAMTLRDAKSPAEVRLLRKLLRTPDKSTRENLLTIALKPSKGVLLSDGSKTSGVRVSGKKFVEALRGLIEKYGNIDADFTARLSEISEESEEVARKLFDMEDKDVRDLQEDAFQKRSVSVWDLEKVEVQEEIEGKPAPWEGKLGDIPAGFDEHGKMQI